MKNVKQTIFGLLVTGLMVSFGGCYWPGDLYYEGGTDTTVPDTNAPDTTAPDTTAPDTTAPDTTAPDTTAPDTTASDTTVMLLIPSGSFWMGCNATVDTECDSDEKPYHKVTMSGYYIDKTEVTQGEYKKCVDAGVCDTPFCNWDPTGTPNRPVVCVNWTQADEYCVWAGKRLPTEAEWEKAARGTDGRKYPWGNETASCELAVMDGCSRDAMDVCSESPAGDSPYGLCDMAGNVWEWVSDWYDGGYYTNSPASNPTGPVSGSGRVLRGGCFYFDYVYLRASDRYGGDPSYDYVSLGFRCARE